MHSQMWASQKYSTLLVAPQSRARFFHTALYISSRSPTECNAPPTHSEHKSLEYVIDIDDCVRVCVYQIVSAMLRMLPLVWESGIVLWLLSVGIRVHYAREHKYECYIMNVPRDDGSRHWIHTPEAHTHWISTSMPVRVCVCATRNKINSHVNALPLNASTCWVGRSKTTWPYAHTHAHTLPPMLTNKGTWSSGFRCAARRCASCAPCVCYVFTQARICVLSCARAFGAISVFKRRSFRNIYYNLLRICSAHFWLNITCDYAVLSNNKSTSSHVRVLGMLYCKETARARIQTSAIIYAV